MFVTSCAGCVEILLLFNRAYAGLCHAIVIATKPHFRVTEVSLGGDNNSLM